jgi:sugar/nucleoside kinase (ribokinase family)
MSGEFDVVCAGIVVVDHVAAPIEFVPKAGQLVLTDECFLTIGGCASNVAVDLSKMKARTTVCGCVGDDPFGQFARKALEDHAVDTTCLTTTRAAATSQTLIINVKGQDRRFIHHPGASSVFCGEHFPRERIRGAKVLYIGGYFLMDRLVPEQVASIFQEARQAGVTTMLDVVTPGPKNYLEQLAIILPHTDVFLPNHDEAQLMTGESDPVLQAEVFRKLGARTAVITCGHQGAVLLSETHRLRAGAFPVEFVDGTGGGDAFDAGYIRGLLEGGTPQRCLELGSALGASCVRKSGATVGVFTRDQADAFLATHQLPIEPLAR